MAKQALIFPQKKQRNETEREDTDTSYNLAMHVNDPTLRDVNYGGPTTYEYNLRSTRLLFRLCFL